MSAAAPPARRRRLPQIGYLALWLAAAAPGLNQLRLLATAIAGRLTYPYDLEWMEGGMLHHALRIQQGVGIYSPPSGAFIPYLYTPLYPGVLAVLGKPFGLSYTLGRAVSVLSLLVIAVVGAMSLTNRRRQHASRAPAWAGLVLGLGLIAATYPFVEGWYDLVRCDTLFAALITAGIAGAARWSVVGAGWPGQARIAAAAAILALSFFCKQTGILYVGFGGAIVLALNWRRVPMYVVVAGAIGLGFVALFDAVTDRWFWTYISEIHRAHDFNWDRFTSSFAAILWMYPTATIAIAVSVVAVAAAWWLGPRDDRGHRRMPPQAQPLVLWSAAYAVSTVVGAVGYGTEFSFFNAYIPAFVHGGLAAGAAVPAIAACARALAPARFADRAAWVASLLVAAVLGIQLARATWDPRRWMPTDADVAAGDKLIAQLKAIDGDVWVPSHPWYSVLAGKPPHVHKMGLVDVTTRQARRVDDVEPALRDHAYAAIVFDGGNDLNNIQNGELHRIREAIGTYYRRAVMLPKDERPRSLTAAKTAPESIWVPAVVAVPPPGAHVVFDFEQATWVGAGWTLSGAAWGTGPVGDVASLAITGASGHRFAASSAGAGGDAATGRVTSPMFALAGTKLTMQLGGSADASKCRVELWVDAAVAATASVRAPGGDAMQTVELAIAPELRDKQATLVLVDDATGHGGHLEVDDVWMWD